MSGAGKQAPKVEKLPIHSVMCLMPFIWSSALPLTMLAACAAVQKTCLALGFLDQALKKQVLLHSCSEHQ